MLLFVYGTLKRGFANHAGLMDRAEFLGPATTCEKYPLYIAGRWNSPVLNNEPNTGECVNGELYRVDQSTLIAVDKFEGTDRKDGYFRKSILVRETGGNEPGEQVVEASAYFKRTDAIVGISGGPLSEFPVENSYVPPAHRPRAGEDL